uniref:Pleckstrin homology domain containing, family N member 1 n=1 Tax=Hippocampus comes TaxID=109280 RepID=A0A3Q2YMV0_HIPCM
MGSSISCVPQHNFTFSSKSFIRRNSSRLFRKKNPQEGQEKSNSIINILCTVTPRKEMSTKDLQTIENIKWDPPFPYDPASGWKKSSINVKNYGRLIHSAKVRFRFLHCQDIHDCYLDLFQTHLHFVSNNTPGLTYQGTLPLKELTICNPQQNCNHSQPTEYAFQINGVSLNPIIVYCANQQEMDRWFGLLKENIEANGGNAVAPENYTRVKQNQEKTYAGREELRNSINKEPIYEWEGSQRDSLGPITYVTKVRLQHLPCQQQSDRLLVMYTSTMIILSEEENGLFYKGKLPLNMITVTTPCQDVKPNTFMIEGSYTKRNTISVVTSIHPSIFQSTLSSQGSRGAGDTLNRWSGNSQGYPESLKFSQSGHGSHSRQFPTHEENPLSPGYSEPLCYSRPSSTETARLGSRTSSFSSHTKPERDPRPLPMRYSSPQRSSYLQPGESSAAMPQLYSTPYAGPRPFEKGLLVKSNSWNTSQTTFGYSLNVPQRHSDMCAPRQPLSPLYDVPCSPEIFALDEVGPVAQQSSWVPPSSFKLRTPPMGRHNRRSLVVTKSQGDAPGREKESPRGQVEQRAEAVSRLKLLNAPSKGQEQHKPIILGIFSPITALICLSFLPLIDLHSYLKPTEPDDQEIDYDNIWESDRHTGMIQPTSVIPTHWTGLNGGARGLGAMATEQRWS